MRARGGQVLWVGAPHKVAPARARSWPGTAGGPSWWPPSPPGGAHAGSPSTPPPFPSFPLLPPSLPPSLLCSLPPAVRPLLLCPASPQPSLQHLKGQKDGRTDAGSSNRRRCGTSGPGVASAWPRREREPRGWDPSGEWGREPTVSPRPACSGTPPLSLGGQLDTRKGFRVVRGPQAGWREPPSALFAR